MKPVSIDLFKQVQFLTGLEVNSAGLPALTVTSIENESYHGRISVFDETLKTMTMGPESLFLFDEERVLLFASNRADKTKKRKANGEELTVFYRLNLDGSEAKEAFEVSLQVNQAVKLSSSKYLFVASIQLDAPDYYCMSEEERKAVLKQRKENEDYQIIDQQPYYQDGAGFINGKRNRLFIYDEKKNELKPLTKEKFHVSKVVVKNENLIYVVGADFEIIRSNREGILEIDLKSNETRAVLKEGHYGIQDMFCTQEKLLVLMSEHQRYGAVENPYIYLLDPISKELELVKENEYSLHSAVGSDCLYLGSKSKQFYQDKLYYVKTEGYLDSLIRLSLDGTEEVLLQLDGVIQGIAVCEQGIWLLAMLKQGLQELYFFDGKELIQKTHINEAVLEDTYVAIPEHITIPAGEFEVDGWVLKPIHYDENKKYPAILDIHGGPKSAYGEVFFHEMQVWASQGYFVFFCNPRGSDGKGNAFAELRGCYGTIDYDDLMNFTDEVLRRYPAIDEKRVGITGGSYGGFMCNWMIGHTDRFAAAASQRSIANWVSLITYADIGFTFDNDQMDADPWSDVKKVWDQSPLQFADRAKTPTLFIHSFEDYRCLLQEGMQMYNALIHFGVPSRMCLFKKESHGLSRIGKPAHRIKRIDEITKWMDQYLKG